MPSVFRTSPAGPSHPGFPNQGFPGASAFVPPPVTLVQNTGDAGAEGVSVSAGNSGGGSGTAFSAVSAGASNTIAFTDAAAIHGARGYLFTKGGTAISILELFAGVEGSTSAAIRGYLNMRGGVGTSAANIGVQARTASAQAGAVQVATGGFIQITNNVTALATGTYPMQAETVYRIEAQWSGNNTAGFGVISAQVYAQDFALLDSITATGVTNPGLLDRFRFGNLAAGAAPSSYIWDSLAVQIGSPAPIGPYQTAYGQPDFIAARATRRWFWLGRRRVPVAPVLTQVAPPAQPLFVQDKVRIVSRQAPVRRSRAGWVPTADAGPPAAARRRPVAPGRRRLVPAARPVPEQQTPPPAAGRSRRFVWGRPRPAKGVPPIPQVLAPVAPVYPVQVARPRRIVLGLRRRLPAVLVPAQVAAPAAPAYPPVAARPRRAGFLGRRRAPAALVPPQVAPPAAPAYVDPARSRRRIALALTRRRPAAVVPDQSPPPPRGLLRRRLVGPVRRTETAVPPPAPAAAPQYPRQTGRRRLLGILLRRYRPQVFPVQPGNPNVTLPRPATLEPGTRGSASAGPGVRVGPAGLPGVRGANSGVPGVRRGGDNEPGTRSGPTISGGQ